MVGTSPPGEFNISCQLKRLIKTSLVIWILGRICAHGFIFNSPVFLQRSNLQKEGNYRCCRGDWWSSFFLWPLNDALPQDTKWYQWFLWCAEPGTVHMWPCPPGIWYRALVLLSWVIEEINGGWSAGGERLLVCSLPAFIRVLRLSEPPRWRDVGGRVELMEGLPLSQKQTRAPFHKWARWLCLNDAETWAESRRSAKVRCGHLKQQQLIHLGGVTELEQNMILSLVIEHLICVFSFPVRRSRSPSQMMYWKNSSDRKLYSSYYVCPQSFHYMSVSIIFTMNLQSLYTFPHNGINCNCLQIHKEKKKEQTANSCKKKNNTRRKVAFLATTHHHEQWENVLSL